MDEENDENSCGICYENLVNPRVLPCWHVACLRCILGMTQTGQGRAVSCHICRMTFLFENIRSLPKPMNCRLCKNSVKNPRKFPCCNDLYCNGCVNGVAIEGLITCRNLCTATRHSVNDLPAAKLCQICFRLHSEPIRDCGHSSCNGCYETSHSEHRPCVVCEAMAAPNPVPQNPQAPMGVNVQEFLRRMNVPGQGLDQLDVRVIQQIAGFVQRLNVENEAQRVRLPPYDNRRYNEKDMINDLPKILVFFVTLALMLYRYGVCGWTWIVPALAIQSSRPRLQTFLGVGLATNIGIVIYGLYCHFYQAAILVGAEAVLIFGLKRTPVNLRIHISTVCNLVIYAIVILYLEPLFLHRHAIAGVLVLLNAMLLQGREYLV